MTDNADKEYWLQIESAILELLEKCKNHLDTESFEAVQHYVEHSEYEMAFEGLWLELMKEGWMPLDIDRRKYFDLGISLNLDRESVFSTNFWSAFKGFIDGGGNFSL